MRRVLFMILFMSPMIAVRRALAGYATFVSLALYSIESIVFILFILRLLNHAGRFV
jgi:hypothetical protein